MKKQLQYGFWPSSLSAQQVAQKKGQRSELKFHNERLFFVEQRPLEQGRSQIVSIDANADSPQAVLESQIDYLPEGVSAGSSVHEYGGAVCTVSGNSLYFVNAKDQQIYHLAIDSPLSEPVQVTDLKATRFADIQVDAHHNQLVAVAEIWSDDKALPDNRLVSISLQDDAFGDVSVLHDQHDFYAAPRLSQTTHQVAFYIWDMPDMPWDKTTLYLADVSENGLSEVKSVVDESNQAPQQPLWHDDTLYFLNDPEGLWTLYLVESTDNLSITQVCQHSGEIGMPPWVFAQQTYAIIKDSVIFTAATNGIWSLYQADIYADNTPEVEKLASTACEFNYFTASDKQVFVKADYPDRSGTIARFEPTEGQLSDSLALYGQEIPDFAVSVAEAISVPVSNGQQTHAFYYPPASNEAEGFPDDTPPLIVIGHGGPSGQSTQSFNDQIQYWTTRGFAVADVNYRGSTGFGRAYRESLYGQWGIYEVEDCQSVANYLVEQGKANADQLIIRGKSAGGYSVLAALSFTDTFSLGAVYYGISDLTALAEDTHKFEYAYCDKLIAPYPAEKQTYIDRSPLYHLDQLSAPIIVFQGLQDKVVPPAQAEAIVSALREKDIAVEYHTFETEKHGFRLPENIVTAFEQELAFYQAHLTQNQ